MCVAEAQMRGDSGLSGKYVKRKGMLPKMGGGSFDIYPVNSESPAQSWREAQAVWNVEDRCKEPGLLAGAFVGGLLQDFQNSGAGVMGHREEVGWSRTWLRGSMDHAFGHLGADGERNEGGRCVSCLDNIMVAEESDLGQNLLCHGSGLTTGKASLGRPLGRSCLLHNTRKLLTPHPLPVSYLYTCITKPGAS